MGRSVVFLQNCNVKFNLFTVLILLINETEKIFFVIDFYLGVWIFFTAIGLCNKLYSAETSAINSILAIQNE